MTKAELRQDWLAGNAVVAFAGALLVAQQWQSTDAVYNLPFNLTISAIPDTGSFIVAAFLFISSFLLALASVVPPKWVPCWVIQVVSTITPTLGFFAWFVFLSGWITTVIKLPDNQWWTYVFAWGGFVMVLFLLYRWVSALVRLNRSSKPRNEGKSDGAVDD